MAESQRAGSPSSSLFIPHDDHYHNEHMARRPRLGGPLALPPMPRSRFPGDGLDFRSPVNYGSTPTAENGGSMVIDLTDDDDSQGAGASMSLNRAHTPAVGPSRAQRLPRYTRDIIGISSDDEEDTEGQVTPPSRPEPWPDSHQHRPGTPEMADFDQSVRDEVEFIATRPRPFTLPREPPDLPEVFNRDATDPIDLTADMDDEVVYQDTRPRMGDNLAPPTALINFTGDNGHYLRHMLLGSNALGPPQYYVHARRQLQNQQARIRHGQAPSVPITVHAMTQAPRDGFDYSYTEFDVNSGSRNRPPSKYTPPDPPAPGFTRSPEEDEAVVCPKCGDELAMGESETKQQIWVVKTCGHAYCGECAQNSAKSTRQTSNKGKGRATDLTGSEPLRKCAVPGCLKFVNSKSMVHVFLGS